MVFVCEVCLKHFLQNYLRSEINTQISIQTPDSRQHQPFIVWLRIHNICY